MLYSAAAIFVLIPKWDEKRGLGRIDYAGPGVEAADKRNASVRERLVTA